MKDVLRKAGCLERLAPATHEYDTVCVGLHLPEESNPRPFVLIFPDLPLDDAAAVAAADEVSAIQREKKSSNDCEQAC